MNEKEEVQVASPIPVILSGIINGLLYCLVWYLATKKNVEPPLAKLVLLNIGFMISTVVIAQIFFRRSIATKVTLTKLWLAGWVASLFFGLVVAIFYQKFFSTIGLDAPPFAQVLFSFNFMGLVISAIIAFFISRIN